MRPAQKVNKKKQCKVQGKYMTERFVELNPNTNTRF